MAKIKYCIVFFLFSFLAAAEGGKVGMAFLKIGVDARAAAMGNAYTAVAYDAAAAYWNPACLALAEQHSVLFMHNAWLLDINHEFAAVQMIRGKHNLAISVNMISVPDIEVRQYPTEEPDGTATAGNMYIAAAYATNLTANWHAGIQIKYLTEKYYMVQSEGFAVDVGVSWTDMLPGLNYSLTVQNMGKMRKLRETATELPLLMRLGVAYRLPYKILENQPLIAADLMSVHKDVTQLNLGAEVPLGDYLALRMGYVFGSDSYNFTTGAGITVNRYQFAYAFVPYGNDLGNTHRISLIITF